MTEKVYYQANPLVTPSSEKIKDYSAGVVALIVIVLHLIFLWASPSSLTPPLPSLKQKVVVQTVRLNPANTSKKSAATVSTAVPSLPKAAEPPASTPPKEPVIPKNDPPAKPTPPKEDPVPKKAEPAKSTAPASPQPTNKPPASKTPPSNNAVAAVVPPTNKEKEQKKPAPVKKSADLKIAQAPTVIEKNRIKKELENRDDEKNRIKKELEEEDYEKNRIKKELEEEDYEKNRIKRELEQQDYEKRREKEALERRDAERKREQEALERRAEEKRRQAKIEEEAAARRRREDKARAARDAARRLAFAQVENSLAKNQESRNQMSVEPATHLPDADLPTLIDKLHIDALPVDIEGMAQWTVKEMDYRDEVAQILQGSLSLPEYGSVKIELLIHKSGKVEKIKVLSSESGKNKQYIESKVPALYFPSFGTRFLGKEQSTFVIILNNEYKI